MSTNTPIYTGHNRPLTNPQRAALGLLFKKAYQRAVDHHATDLNEADWRREQCITMVGCTISNATNGQYEMLKMYGEDLCGNSGKAFALAMLLPEQEKIRLQELVRRAIARWSDYGMTDAYAAAIIKGKFGSKQPKDLTPWELSQLVYTINNRGQAKKEKAEGRFDGSKRNKKQRRSFVSTPEEKALGDAMEARPLEQAPTWQARDPEGAL